MPTLPRILVARLEASCGSRQWGTTYRNMNLTEMVGLWPVQRE